MHRSPIWLPVLLLAAPALGGPQTSDLAEDPTARLNGFLETSFQSRVDRHPELQTRLGVEGDSGSWDDFQDVAVEREMEIAKQELAFLWSQFDPRTLNEQGRLSYRLYEREALRRIADHEWRFHDYPVNQMFGLHSRVPSFLISMHRIEDVRDARDYVSRLRRVQPLFARLVEGLRRREQLGVWPPRFVFPHAIRDCENLLAGAPWEPEAADGALLADFRAKVEALEIEQGARDSLIAEASTALLENVGPAYRELIVALRDQATRAPEEAGCWRLPDGAAFYQHRLRAESSSRLSPDEIHALGLREVQRLHGEMRAVLERIEFEGDLGAFFEHVRSGEGFTYPNDAEGRARYLREATAAIDAMSERLDELFVTKPQADLDVRAVEAWRERSAGKAFYQQGTPDGTRPGIYYANLYDMTDMPVYQMEALAFHEGIPGHHMQISIAQELEDLPRFRRHADHTAYSEGWALYTELVPREMGFYADPYSDFGRLAMELWRACRLVVDTGMHHLRWSREQAIEYLTENTPNPRGDCVKAIERYAVMPGQATAYKIGMNRILELREEARAELGERFDLRVFHEVVLTSGPLPLDLLGENVQTWIESTRALPAPGVGAIPGGR